MKIMYPKEILASAVFVIAAAGCSGPGGPNPGSEIFRPDPALSKVITETVGDIGRTMGNDIPGLSVVIADSDGILWEAGFGTADGRTPVDPGTMFSVQSMSKTYTAVGVLTAVRDGLVELDAPIVRYLPDFTVNSIFDPAPEEKITLRHLLMHTAGFTHEAPVGGNFDPSEPSFEEHCGSISSTWLRFPVGEQYAYSNLGIDLAAHIVERVSGIPFPDYMEQRVFAPLGLSRSTMDPDTIRNERNRATGHTPGMKSLPVVVPMMGAGGVYASAHDLGLFIGCMLRAGRDEGSVLNEALFREMNTTPNRGVYGLGIAIGRRGTDLFFTHGGGGYGFLSYMAWYPTLGIGVGVLTNSEGHESLHVALADRIVNRLEEAGIVSKRFSLPSLPVCGITLSDRNSMKEFFEANPEKTRFRPGWGAYTGTYRFTLKGEPEWWAQAKVTLGLLRDILVRVERRGDAMTLDGIPLLEYEPGFFFTESGETLDFRRDPPVWRNIAVRKL